MSNIIDWILDLFRHEDAARAFVAAPEQTLRDAGLGAVPASQLSAVAASAVPGMVLGQGDPVLGLQRAVSNHYGFAPATNYAPSNDFAPSLLSPTYAPSPTFAPQTDLLSHNATSWASPEQSSGANSQAGAFNLGFGDIVLGGNKTTATDGSTVVNGQVHGSVVSGEGAVLGNGNEVNNGDVLAGTGSNVTVGHGDIEDHGTTNTGSGSVIKDNSSPVFQDVDASGGHGGGASGGDSLIGLGSGNAHGGNAGGGGIVVVNRETDTGNTATSVTHTQVESHTATTVADYSDHSASSVVDNSGQHSASLFDAGQGTSLVDSSVDSSHDVALASGNHLLGF